MSLSLLLCTRLGIPVDHWHSSLQLAVGLLDGTPCPLPVMPHGATVKDAMVAIRAELGLRADADFSLFLFTRNGASASGRDDFICLPDVTPLEEAEQLARE